MNATQIKHLIERLEGIANQMQRAQSLAAEAERTTNTITGEQGEDAWKAARLSSSHAATAIGKLDRLIGTLHTMKGEASK